MATSTRPQVRRGHSGAWNRLRPEKIDALDAYGLPSKGEARLHDHKTQEAYYSRIVERYMTFCASSGNSDDLGVAFNSLAMNDSTQTTFSRAPTIRQPFSRRLSDTERPSDLVNILMAMRKLREGILGSRRCDNFAQCAYKFIIHASILTRSWESYQPALLYLLRWIHPRTPLSASELQEFAGYHILDLACRQHELLDSFRVRLEFNHKDRRIGVVLKSLVQDDWVWFWRTKRAVDGYQRAIIEFAEERMRLHALKCLGRGYMTADKAFIERSGDASWDDLVKSGVGWQLQESGDVIIRKPKPKA